MKKNYNWILISAAIIALTFIIVNVTSSSGSNKTDTDKNNLVAIVTKGDLNVDVTIAGKFEAKDKDEITMKPKAYKGDLIVKRVLNDGTPVKKGDVLIEFEKESLDKAIKDAEAAIEKRQLDFSKKENENKSFILDRDVKDAAFQKQVKLVENNLSLKKEELKLAHNKQKKSLRNAKESLADAKINFKQFEELYNARELPTATERILLNREKRSVRSAEERLQDLIIKQENDRKFTLDKAVVEVALELERKKAEYKKHQIEIETRAKEKLIEMATAKQALTSAIKRLDELKMDSKTLKIISPRDGVLFYGSLSGSGNPFGITISSMGGNNVKKQLHQGGRVRTHVVLLTVASMKNLSIVMDAREIDIQHIKSGQSYTAIPDAYASMQIDGKIKKVGHIAKRQGFSFSNIRLFPVEAEYEYKDEYTHLRAGMNCKVTIQSDKIEGATLVPILAVFEENGKHFCLIDNEGKAEKRVIEIGKTDGSQVEIKEGLRVGQKVYLYNPNKD